MKRTFKSVSIALKPNAPFAIVIGTNHTTLGGNKIEINTPRLLTAIAASSSWTLAQHIPLQTYQRYGLHSRNSVRHESLLVLRNAK